MKIARENGLRKIELFTNLDQIFRRNRQIAGINAVSAQCFFSGI